MFIYFMGGLLLLGVILLVAYYATKTNEKYQKVSLNFFKIGLILVSMSATYLLLNMFM